MIQVSFTASFNANFHTRMYVKHHCDKVQRHFSYSIHDVNISGEKAGTSKDSISNMKDGKAKELPSFWIPALTPDSKPTLVKKPVSQEDRCDCSYFK